MARYIGPVCRLCRRNGDKLMLKGGRCFTPKCAFERRSQAPGPRPARRQRLSDRGIQLREKQKARYSYGMLERQFRRFFAQAAKQPGITADNLLVLLERRLDNVVCHLGFADSLAQARQLIQHGHITVNERRTDIPSFLVKEGDTISWQESSKKTEYYKQVVQSIESKSVVGWLSLDKAKLVGKAISLPTPGDVEPKYEGKSIVEYYSR